MKCPNCEKKNASEANFCVRCGHGLASLKLQTCPICLEDKKFPCTTGIQYRDFLYIDDFVSSINKCLDNKKCFKQIINIGLGKPIKVKKIINNIKNIIKSGNPQFGKILMRNYEQKKVYPSIKKAFKYIRWRPKVTLDKGLNKTIKFYKSLKK